jgi:hypothetical protein
LVTIASSRFNHGQATFLIHDRLHCLRIDDVVAELLAVKAPSTRAQSDRASLSGCTMCFMSFSFLGKQKGRMPCGHPALVVVRRRPSARLAAQQPFASLVSLRTSEGLDKTVTGQPGAHHSSKHPRTDRHNTSDQLQ